MKLDDLTESTLAEVCSLVTDGTHDTPKRVTSGFPLIKAKEIVGGRIDFESCDQISEAEHRKVIARSKPEFGDTLFTHIGASLGEAVQEWLIHCRWRASLGHYQECAEWIV